MPQENIIKKHILQKNLIEITNRLPLQEKHYQEISIGSGILDDTIQDYLDKGLLNSISIKQGESILGYRVNSKALLWTYPDLHEDKISPYFDIKHDNPPKDKNGKIKKYIKPKGLEPRIYRPLEVSPDYLFSTKPIIITEGCKKAVKTSSEGFPTISIGGVNNWQSNFNGSGIISDLLKIPFENRTVYLIFDSDIVTKPKVKKALQDFALYLTRTYVNVNVRVPILPHNDNTKCGLDDYFVNGGTKESFRELLSGSEPFYKALKYKGIIKFPNVYKNANLADLWSGTFGNVGESGNARLEFLRKRLAS